MKLLPLVQCEGKRISMVREWYGDVVLWFADGTMASVGALGDDNHEAGDKTEPCLVDNDEEKVKALVATLGDNP